MNIAHRVEESVRTIQYLPWLLLAAAALAVASGPGMAVWILAGCASGLALSDTA